MLPDSLDPSTLRSASLAGVVVVALAVLATLRFIQKLVVRLVLVGLLVVVGVALWVQRDDLTECRDAGSCSFFGQDVHVPSGGSG